MRLAGEFTAGCLLYRAFVCGAGRLLPRKLADVAFLVSLVLMESGRWLPAVLLAFGAMFISLVCQESILRRILSQAPAEFLGEISYSLYAMHWMIFQCANWWLDEVGRPQGAMAFGMATLLVVAPFVTAVCTWKWVEMPARAWGRQLSRRMDRPDSTQAVVADQGSSTPQRPTSATGPKPRSTADPNDSSARRIVPRGGR